MARSSSRRSRQKRRSHETTTRGRYNQSGRDARDIASGGLTLPRSAVLLGVGFSKNSGSTYLRSIEDRRTWHPEGINRPARLFHAPSARFRQIERPYRRPNEAVRSAAFTAFKSFAPAGIAFQNPSRVLICVRRNIRREVLHARGVAGRSGLRPPRRSWSSGISCR